MGLSVLLSIALVLLNGFLVKQSFGAMLPVYGFSGAASATTSGRTLHYTVHLHKCQQISGPADPEFVVTFGGHVATWRSFNDRDIAPIPFMTFYDQKPVYNNTGHLAQLSREVLILGNDSVLVASNIYSADLSRDTYSYRHECSMTSQTTKGHIDLLASSDLPVPYNSFADIVGGLEAGVYVHFTAMTFLCVGGKEHSFSSFGGHIPNYDLVYDDDALVEIKTSVQQIAHFDEKDKIGVLDVINMRLFNNRTVDIYDNLGVPPAMQRVAVRKAQCILSTGMPGDYDIVYDDDTLVEIKTSVQEIAHFDEKDKIGVLDVINMRLFNNRTVDIYDNLGVPPAMQRVAVRKAQCILSTGMPGGMVQVWGRRGPTSNCY